MKQEQLLHLPETVIFTCLVISMPVVADNATLKELQKDFLDTCKVTEQCVTEYQRRCTVIMKEVFPKCETVVLQGGANAAEQYADCIGKHVMEPLEKLSMKEEYMECREPGGSKKISSTGARGLPQYFSEMSFNVDSIMTYPDPLSACRAGANNSKKWIEQQQPEVAVTITISKAEPHARPETSSGEGVAAYRNYFERPVQDYGVCQGKKNLTYKTATAQHKKGTVLEQHHEDRLYFVNQ